MASRISPISPVGPRLDALIKALGYNRRMSDFAASVGVGLDHISRIKTGKATASETLILAICCIHKVNRAWLERGEGPMFAGGEEAEAGDFSPVPLADVRLAAGHGAEIYSEGELTHLLFKTAWLRGELRASVRNLVAMYVVGDSMEPTLSARDVVLVDRSATDLARPGIYALRQDNVLLIKRVQMEGERVLLVSDNPDYPPTVFPWPGPIHRAQVIGRVVWAGKRF